MFEITYIIQTLQNNINNLSYLLNLETENIGQSLKKVLDILTAIRQFFSVVDGDSTPGVFILVANAYFIRGLLLYHQHLDLSLASCHLILKHSIPSF